VAPLLPSASARLRCLLNGSSIRTRSLRLSHSTTCSAHPCLRFLHLGRLAKLASGAYVLPSP
jgi:hypothetical protein